MISEPAKLQNLKPEGALVHSSVGGKTRKYSIQRHGVCGIYKLVSDVICIHP